MWRTCTASPLAQVFVLRVVYMVRRTRVLSDYYRIHCVQQMWILQTISSFCSPVNNAKTIYCYTVVVQANGGNQALVGVEGGTMPALFANERERMLQTYLLLFKRPKCTSRVDENNIFFNSITHFNCFQKYLILLKNHTIKSNSILGCT